MKLLFLVLVLSFSASAFAVQGESCVMTTQTDFGATTVSTKAFSTSPYRKCLMFMSKSLSTFFIKFGSAHTGTEGFVLSGMSTYWIPVIIPTNSVYIKSNSGNATITILEGR